MSIVLLGVLLLLDVDAFDLGAVESSGLPLAIWAADGDITRAEDVGEWACA